MKIIVVGAGSFGSWSALKLRQAGCKVVLIDAWGPGNSLSSSGGETRVIRTVYGSDDLYVDMARHAIQLWDDFQKSVGEPLMELTGSLWLCGEDDSYVRAAAPRIQSLGLQLEEYHVDQARTRWPQICFDGLNHVFLEPLSGLLRARQACSAVAREFQRLGGELIHGMVQPPRTDGPCHELLLHTGEKLVADQIVLAAGPWLSKLVPAMLEGTLEVTRQEVYYFAPPPGQAEFEVGRLPIWLELNQPIYYGIPSLDRRGFKLARDERGTRFDPDHDDRQPTRELVEQARSYLHARFPRMGQAPLVESRVCQYSNSPDGHFLLDRHAPSGLILAGGGSGHGFKMGPVIGEQVVQLVSQDRRTPQFGLERFAKLQGTTTQFEHSQVRNA